MIQFYWGMMAFHVMIFFVQTINANTLQYETDTKWDIVN